jgi:YgiT-type zinc finger domain-containing protein
VDAHSSDTTSSSELTAHECPVCGGNALREELAKSAFWHFERLVVVEDIPALVCGKCGERFYDDATATALDLMHGDGFPADRASGQLHVLTFSFSYRVPANPARLEKDKE